MDAQEKEALDALQKYDARNLEKLLGSAPPATAAATAAGLPYCTEYCALRPILAKLLPYVRRLPFIGGRLAQFIELLMRIADSVCDCK